MFGFLNSDLVTLVIGTFTLPFARGFSLFESFSHPFSQTFTFGFHSTGEGILGVFRFLSPSFLSFRTQGFTAGCRSNQTVESLKKALAFVLGGSVNKSFQSFQQCSFRSVRHLSLRLSIVSFGRFTIESLLNRGANFPFEVPSMLPLTFSVTGGFFPFTLASKPRSFFSMVPEFTKKLHQPFKQIRFTVSPTSSTRAILRGLSFGPSKALTYSNLDTTSKTTRPAKPTPSQTHTTSKAARDETTMNRVPTGT